MKPLEGVYASLQPEVGRIYPAEYHTYHGRGRIIHEIAVITINNKLIALREGEFERVE